MSTYLVLIAVLTIAAGFVRRAVAGVGASGVAISPWLLVSTRRLGGGPVVLPARDRAFQLAIAVWRLSGVGIVDSWVGRTQPSATSRRRVLYGS